MERYLFIHEIQILFLSQKDLARVRSIHPEGVSLVG